jgi:hypothetical protein
MKQKWFLVLILFLNAFCAWSQINITGTIYCKEDKLPVPGAVVIIKGTQKGTITDLKGNFSITVSDPNDILVVSAIGMVTKEIKLNGQKNVSIVIKSDCNIDTFDQQHIGILINSGVINNPLGGEFDFSFPAFLRFTTLKTSISYQTDLKRNEFFNSQIDFDHVILHCDFQMDIKWNYRSIFYSDDLEARAYSFETHLIRFNLYNLNIYQIGLIAGCGQLFYENSTDSREVTSGPVVGLTAFLGKPLFLSVSGKATMFRNHFEYQGQIHRGYKKLNAFVRFYKLDSFTELSIGMGISMTYWLKRQRKMQHKSES